FGMWHTEAAIVPAGLPEDHVGGIELQVLPDPFLPPKPYQLHLSRVVNKISNQPFPLFLFHRSQVDYFSNNLYLRIIALQLADLVKSGLVQIPVREEIQQVLVRVNADLLPQQISPVRAYSFQVIYGGLEDIATHETKI